MAVFQTTLWFSFHVRGRWLARVCPSPVGPRNCRQSSSADNEPATFRAMTTHSAALVIREVIGKMISPQQVIGRMIPPTAASITGEAWGNEGKWAATAAHFPFQVRLGKLRDAVRNPVGDLPFQPLGPQRAVDLVGLRANRVESRLRHGRVHSNAEHVRRTAVAVRRGGSPDFFQGPGVGNRGLRGVIRGPLIQASPLQPQVAFPPAAAPSASPPCRSGCLVR